MTVQNGCVYFNNNSNATQCYKAVKGVYAIVMKYEGIITKKRNNIIYKDVVAIR